MPNPHLLCTVYTRFRTDIARSVPSSAEPRRVFLLSRRPNKTSTPCSARSVTLPRIPGTAYGQANPTDLPQPRFLRRPRRPSGPGRRPSAARTAVRRQIPPDRRASRQLDRLETPLWHAGFALSAYLRLCGRYLVMTPKLARSVRTPATDAQHSGHSYWSQQHDPAPHR